MIAEGRVAEGERLPPERRLAAELRVSRASLREAISTLEGLGVVRVRAGRGTFVAADLDAANGAAHGPTEGYAPREIYQFRMAAEGYAARLAAMRAGPEGLERLRQAQDAFRAAALGGDLGTTSRLDYEFHRCLMTIAGNRVLADQYSNLRAALLAGQLRPLARPDRLWQPVVEHGRLLEAVARSDPDGAEYFMRLHITKAATAAGVALDELP